MKKLLLALSLGSALSLAGCLTAAQVIALVQQDAVLACQFEPTAATVAAIIAALNPAAVAIEQQAAAIAGQICNAVAAKAANPSIAGPATMTVNGVVIPVNGHFTTKTVHILKK